MCVYHNPKIRETFSFLSYGCYQRYSSKRPPCSHVDHNSGCRILVDTSRGQKGIGGG